MRKLLPSGIDVVTAGLVATLLLASLTPGAAAATGSKHRLPRRIDPQSWELPEHMQWSDFKPIPGVDYSEQSPTKVLHAALILGDFQDQPFRVTQKTRDPSGQKGLGVKDPAAYYKKILFSDESPSTPQHGHTVNDFWMEDSYGTIGVDATEFGPYTMDGKMYQYGIGDFGSAEDCPDDSGCSSDFDSELVQKSANDVEAAQTAAGHEFDFRFLLHAGYDESGTWLNFGMGLFPNRDAVTDPFGPPGSSQGRNWVHTRYVDWTSFFAGEQIWSHALPGLLATEGESDGGSVFSHELSHVLGILDNYNNPYAKPPDRAYSGPWDTMSRGSFNGPGGPWARWTIPARESGTMASEHMLRNKIRLGFLPASEVNTVQRDSLAQTGPVVTKVLQRESPPDLNDTSLYNGMRIVLGQDRSSCDDAKPKCDGGGYDFYDVEVVNRQGFDSFLPDHGVLISKSKAADASPFIWVIDSHPQNLHLTDYITAGGKHVPYTVGDYRQLVDATFHAGTGRGVVNKYVDKVNDVALFVLAKHVAHGRLIYTVAAEAPSAVGDTAAKVVSPRKGLSRSGAHPLTFKVSNTTSSNAIYKLTLKAKDVRARLLNDLLYVPASATKKVEVWVDGPVQKGDVRLRGVPT